MFYITNVIISVLWKKTFVSNMDECNEGNSSMSSLKIPFLIGVAGGTASGKVITFLKDDCHLQSCWLANFFDWDFFCKNSLHWQEWKSLSRYIRKRNQALSKHPFVQSLISVLHGRKNSRICNWKLFCLRFGINTFVQNYISKNLSTDHSHSQVLIPRRRQEHFHMCNRECAYTAQFLNQITRNLWTFT